jgi:hypothetical protein
MSAFVDAIHAIYDRHPANIYPFIGGAFLHPNDEDFRVMGVGINAYSGDDRHNLTPAMHATWFEKKAFRFQRAVSRDLEVLGSALTAAPHIFAGLKCRGMASIFMTNAVKVYVHESEGKRASQLSTKHFEQHLQQWRDELDAMAAAGAMPHVIVIVGSPFWSYAWETFKGARLANIRVDSHGYTSGETLHYVNRYSLTVAGRRHHLLLVRLRHPSSRRSQGSPEWLMSKPEFVKITS